jgi:porphobilinogen synthase
MPFPIHRMRRMRRNEQLRTLVRQTSLELNDLVMPLFVRPGNRVSRPISSMPGQSQLSVDFLVDECLELESLGISAVLLFGVPEPESKDEEGSEAWNENGLIPQAVRAIKKKCPRLIVITDVCLCEYASHGHCGKLKKIGGEMQVDNDATLDLLAKAAVAYARAGADIIAPSDMMDGRVSAIRRALDDKGFDHIPILSYAAKFASAFYGPFRQAADSAPAFGDRKTYQMDYHNGDEAMREIQLDIEEGADMIMVKPALAYLDLIYRAKQTFNVPVVCYNVSGEYAMLKAAAQQGWLDERSTVIEALTGMKRAGADIIITYFAKDVAEWFRQIPPLCPTE